MELADRWHVPPWEIAEADAAELFGALDVMRIRDDFASAREQRAEKPAPRLN